MTLGTSVLWSTVSTLFVPLKLFIFSFIHWVYMYYVYLHLFTTSPTVGSTGDGGEEGGWYLSGSLGIYTLSNLARSESGLDSSVLSVFIASNRKSLVTCPSSKWYSVETSCVNCAPLFPAF